MSIAYQLYNSDNIKSYPIPFYPKDSIIITNSNVNPSRYYGEEWKLIDKEFTYFSRSYNYTSNPNISTVFTHTSAIDIEKSSIYIQRIGHSLVIRLWLVTAVEVADDTIELGRLNLETLGVNSSLIHTQSGLCAGSDVGNGIFLLSIDNNGIVSSLDVIPKGTTTKMAASSTPRVETIFNLGANYMLDSMCNKFYWERTS